MNPEPTPPDGTAPADAVTPDETPAPTPEPDLTALLAAERVANDYHP
jgi:hypothetical protein